MKAVDEGKCAASSAKGLSSMGICARRIGLGMRVWVVCVGMLTKPGIAENTCVMPREARSVGFSASARSERYRWGIISVGLTDGEWWWPALGWVDDNGVLGGTVRVDAPQGEMGDIGNIDGFVE